MLVENNHNKARARHGKMSKKGEKTHRDMGNQGNRRTCKKAYFLLMLGIHKGINLTETNNTTNTFKVHGNKEN